MKENAAGCDICCPNCGEVDCDGDCNFIIIPIFSEVDGEVIGFKREYV